MNIEVSKIHNTYYNDLEIELFSKEFDCTFFAHLNDFVTFRSFNDKGHVKINIPKEVILAIAEQINDA